MVESEKMEVSFFRNLMRTTFKFFARNYGHFRYKTFFWWRKIFCLPLPADLKTYIPSSYFFSGLQILHFTVVISSHKGRQLNSDGSDWLADRTWLEMVGKQATKMVLLQ